MELCLFATLAGVGYLLNKSRQPGTEIAYAGATLSPAVTNHPPASSGDVPSMRSVYDSRHLEVTRAEEARRAENKARMAMDPVHTGVVCRGQSQSVRRSSVVRDLPQEGLVSALSGQRIAIEHFTHNNMVPFYSGSSVKQNTSDGAFQGRMEAFTGVDPEAPLGRKLERAPLFQPKRDNLFGVPVDDLRSAYMDTMPTSRNRAFENPTPELVRRPGVVGGGTDFGAREAQMPRSVDETRVGSNPKQTFEGRVLPGALSTADSRLAKQPAVLNMRQSTVVEKSPADMVPSRSVVTRESHRPTEEVRDTTRQSNARHFIGPAAPGEHSASVYRDSTGREPFRASLAAPQVGPAAPASVTHVDDYGRAGIQIYTNERDVTTTRVHRGNLVTAVKALVAPLQDLVRDTRKDSFVDAPRAFGNVEASRLTRATVYDTNDVARTTIKEAGMAEAPLANLRGPVTSLTVYDPDDVMRATMRETGLAEAPLTNMRPHTYASTVHDPNDVSRTTGKESILSQAPGANLRPHAYVSTVYDPEDVLRTTGKDVSLHDAPNANLRSHTYVSTVYDPEDVTRTTGKEASLHEAPNANLRTHTYVSGVYDPESVARTTGKETNLSAGNGGVLSTARRAPTVYDTDDLARVTTRQTMRPEETNRNFGSAVRASTSYDAEAWRPPTTVKQVATECGRGADGEDGNVGALQGHGRGGYDTAEYDARITQKQSLADSGVAFGGASIAAGSGYIVGAPDDARDTLRQTTSDVDYYGHGHAGTAAQMSYDDAAAARIDPGRELIEQGRDPTQSSVKLSAGTEAYGVGQRERQMLHDVDGQQVSGGRFAPPPSAPMSGMSSTGGRNEYAWDSGDRLADEVAGATAQLSGNPYALPPRVNSAK